MNYFTALDRVKESKSWFLLLTMSLVLVTLSLFIIDEKISISFIGLLIGLVFLFILLRHPIYTSLINIFVSVCGFFLVNRLLGLKSAPMGLVIDAMNFIAIALLFVRGQLKGGKTVVGVFFLLWLVYCFIELLNPSVISRSAWFLAFRIVIGFVVPFFIYYTFFKTKKHGLKMVLNTWIICLTINALYTLYQEFAGYPPWDYALVTSSEKIYKLLFTFGRFRKIGTMVSPTASGVSLAINAILCLSFFFKKEFNLAKKILFLILFFLSTWAMLYTGTRTATVVWIIGIIFYTILTRERLLIYASIFMFFIVLPFMVATNRGGNAFKVMSTAFSGSEDPSMKVRLDNQLLLRQYLFDNPLGYGLGSTGAIGKKYTPNTFMANFPPDSEHVKIVIEYGVIGLILWMLFQFSIINNGIKSMQTFDEGSDQSNLMKASVAIGIILVVAQYPQEILILTAPKQAFALFCAILCLRKEDNIEI